MDAEHKVSSAVTMLTECFRAGGKLLLCGNGGSAADCGHITGELAKGFLCARPLPGRLTQAIGAPWASKLQEGLPVLDLTVNGALIAAIINDLDGGNVFAQQVMAYGRAGDVLLGISTSGNAENICRAMRVARALGMRTIALTGRGGGRLAGLADLLLDVEETETYLVQEKHLPLYHRICMDVERALFEDDK